MSKKFTEEGWFDIPGFQDYYISAFGEVYSARSNKILKKNLRNGYYYVTLYDDKSKVHKYIHRLVAENFISNKESYPMINHKDENKLNNEANNLEWCTSEYNVNYGNGNQRRGKNSGIKHRKPVIAYKNGQTVLAGSINELSEKIKSRPSGISAVLHNKQKTTRGYDIYFYNPEMFDKTEVE